MGTTPADIATAYFAAWKGKDFDAYRSLLAADVDFVGALGEAHGADECVAGLRKLAEITTDIVIHKLLADGTDVLTWFDLHTTAAPPCPVANWTHVEDGEITRIRVTFDPRPLLPPS